MNSADSPTNKQCPAWQLGVVRDRGGHVHLGALLPHRDGPPVYVDLLSAVGALSAAELDLSRLVILVYGKQLDEFLRLVETCIDDERLRTRIVDLASAAEYGAGETLWTD